MSTLAAVKKLCPRFNSVRRLTRLPAALSFSPPYTARMFSTAAHPDANVYHLLQYRYVDEMLQRRAPVRPLHLAYATPYAESGKLVLGGAFPPEVKEGHLVFKASRQEVEDFARNDPYVTSGLVEEWKVREWTVVLGAAYRS